MFTPAITSFGQQRACSRKFVADMTYTVNAVAKEDPILHRLDVDIEARPRTASG